MLKLWCKIDAKAEICPKCGVRVKVKVPIVAMKSPGLAAVLSFLIVGLARFTTEKLAREFYL